MTDRPEGSGGAEWRERASKALSECEAFLRSVDWNDEQSETDAGDLLEMIREALRAEGQRSGTETYPCAKCGRLRTKAEGGTVFTVCDECWTPPFSDGEGRSRAGEATTDREVHARCHDLVCNGDRRYPRGFKGVSCSCRGRDGAYQDKEAAGSRAATLQTERDEARRIAGQYALMMSAQQETIRHAGELLVACIPQINGNRGAWETLPVAGELAQSARAEAMAACDRLIAEIESWVRAEAALKEQP